MKQIILIIASLLFSTLFYNQNIGINLSIFSLVAVLLLFAFNRDRFGSIKVILFATAYLLTAFLVFFINSQLSILANCVAFVTLVGAVSNSQTSIFISWFNGLYTTIAGFFHRNFEVIEEGQSVKVKKSIDIWHWIKLIGIPTLFIGLFVFLYQNGNPIFERFITGINFEWLNLQWILFAVLGYFLFGNISRPVLVDSATTADLSAGNHLKNKGLRPEEQLLKEKQLGTLLLTVLNLLILFYLITDVVYLLDSQSMSDLSLTERVHSSVYALIASILLAICILLFFFRGDLNFYKGSIRIKQLSYLWIALNALLVCTVIIKNNQYVGDFGLTYKRIGVYIYALLTFFGLASTFFKLLQIKNIWYLFRVNTAAVFVVLMACSFIDWDVEITRFNLEKTQRTDFYYLLNLSERNVHLLRNHAEKNELTTELQLQIQDKYLHYLEKSEEKNWQELTYNAMNLSQQPKNSTR